MSLNTNLNYNYDFCLQNIIQTDLLTFTLLLKKIFQSVKFHKDDQTKFRVIQKESNF